MFRKLNLIAAGALALAFCVTGQGQDAPSLGDLARQAQKTKTTNTSSKVFTNDDIASGAAADSYTLGPTAVQPARPTAATQPAATASAADQLEKLEEMLTKVDALDRATLARNVLQGSDADFPGRAKWEERLYAAKQSYVTQGRALLDKARQIQASEESLNGAHDPSDPRVKQIAAKLQDLVRDGVQVGAAFQAVMLEGRDLAGLPAAH